MAKEEKHIIDRLFSEGLEGAEAPVSNDLWEGIAARMETDTLRKKVFYARFTAAASLLLLLGLSTWFFVSSNFQDEKTGKALLTNEQVISLPLEIMGNPIPLPDGYTEQQNTKDTAPTTLKDTQRTDGLNFAATNNGIKLGNNPAGRSGILNNFFIDQFGTSKTNTSTPLPSQKVVDQGPTKEKGNVSTDNESFSGSLATANPQEKEDLEGISIEPQATFALAKTALTPDFERLNPKPVTMDIEDTDEIIGANLRSPALFNPESNSGFTPKQSSTDNRWAMGGAFAPDYTFATTSPVQNQLSTSSRTINLQEPIDADKATSPLVSAFTTGMNFSFRISDRMGLQSGLFYTNRQSSATSNLNSFGKALVVNSDFSLNLLEIPLLFQYSLIHQDNFDYYVSSGISANLLWNYNNTISNAEGQVSARLQSPDENTFQPSQGNLLLRTGIRYRMFNKVSLNVEPGLRYGLLTSDYAFSNGNPVSLSLNSGINYHF